MTTRRSDDPTLQDLTFDYVVIANQIRQARVRNDKPAPELGRINSALTSIRYEDTIEGSSTLTVELIDPGLELIEFFDIDKDGQIERLDITYPKDSASKWRLTQLGVSTDMGSELLTLTFMERPALLLMGKHGPKKSSRGRMTRAQFFKSLVEEVDAHPLKFRCQELNRKQAIVNSEPIDRDRNRREHKNRGINKDEDLTIAGAKAKDPQLGEVQTALDVAQEVGASERITIAMLCAGIGESGFKPIMNRGGSPYGGVFQGNVRGGVWDINDTAGMARCFINGGKGFQPSPSGGNPGGARYWASQHKDWGPGTIAIHVEGSQSNFSSALEGENHYGQWSSEAEALIEAYGGGFTGGGSFHRAQYNFQIGSEEEPNEDYWTGMTRLADEVRWRLFIDGRTVYFDDDMTLIKQKPVAVIRRNSPSLISYNATWDRRKIATEMTLDLICDPFEFRAGEVFKLVGFGPLSRASTAKPKPLPGRWLIVDSSRESGSYVTTFTLRQPQRPLREPSTERVADEEQAPRGGSADDIERGMTAKDVIDQLVLPIARKHDMVTGRTPAMVETANGNHNTLVAGSTSTSWHKGPPQSKWAADMSNGGAPTPQMDALADELARKFGFPQGQNHVYAFPSATAKGYRFQLGYKTNIGGNHFNHVHFGVENTNPLSQEQLNSVYGWGQ